MPHKAPKLAMALPAFKSEAEERTFWKTHDATDYLDLSKAQRVRFFNLKASETDEVIHHFSVESMTIEQAAFGGSLTDFKS